MTEQYVRYIFNDNLRSAVIFVDITTRIQFQWCFEKVEPTEKPNIVLHEITRYT